MNRLTLPALALGLTSCLVAAAIVHMTDTIRPMLIYLACELIVPALVISRLNMKQAERTGDI